MEIIRKTEMEYEFYFIAEGDQSATKHNMMYSDFKISSGLDKFSNILQVTKLVGKTAEEIVAILEKVLISPALKDVISMPGKQDISEFKHKLEILKSNAKLRNGLSFYSKIIANPKLINLELQQSLGDVKAKKSKLPDVTYPSVVVSDGNTRKTFEIKTRDDALLLFHHLFQRNDPSAYVWLRYASVL